MAALARSALAVGGSEGHGQRPSACSGRLSLWALRPAGLSLPVRAVSCTGGGGSGFCAVPVPSHKTAVAWGWPRFAPFPAVCLPGLSAWCGGGHRG